jgi:hypothetical protein
MLQSKSNTLLLPHVYKGEREAYDMVGDTRYSLIKGGKTWDAFVNKSTEIALADKRGLIICPKPVREAGLGNALFATAGTIALAHRYDYKKLVLFFHISQPVTQVTQLK